MITRVSPLFHRAPLRQPGRSLLRVMLALVVALVALEGHALELAFEVLQMKTTLSQ